IPLTRGGPKTKAAPLGPGDAAFLLATEGEAFPRGTSREAFRHVVLFDFVKVARWDRCAEQFVQTRRARWRPHTQRQPHRQAAGLTVEEFRRYLCLRQALGGLALVTLAAILRRWGDALRERERAYFLVFARRRTTAMQARRTFKSYSPITASKNRLAIRQNRPVGEQPSRSS